WEIGPLSSIVKLGQLSVQTLLYVNSGRLSWTCHLKNRSRLFLTSPNVCLLVENWMLLKTNQGSFWVPAFVSFMCLIKVGKPPNPEFNPVLPVIVGITALN